MNFNITQFMVTEVYGPSLCAEHDEAKLSVSERASKKSSQGTASHLMTGFEVLRQAPTSQLLQTD